MKAVAVLCLFSWTILTKLQSAYAVECYTCVQCNDPFNKGGKAIIKMPCTGSCMKAKVDGTVARSCNPLKMKDKCDEEEKDGHSGAICYCNSDLCNGSVHVQVTMATALIVMANIVRRFL